MIDIVTGHRVDKDLRKRFPGEYKYKNKGAKHNFGLAIEFDPYPSDKTQTDVWAGPFVRLLSTHRFSSKVRRR